MESASGEGLSLNGAEMQEEIKAAERVINDFRFYSEHIKYIIRRERRCIGNLPPEDMKLLENVKQDHSDIFRRAMENQKVLEQAIQFTKSTMPLDHALSVAANVKEVSSSTSETRMSKIRSLFKQMVRDWSAEGADERNSCYERVIRGICERFPKAEDRHCVQVLVPGSGLSRLAWELCNLGFSTLANEFDFIMILMSNLMLNAQLEKEEISIYPYITDRLNSWCTADQIREVKLPDRDMSAASVLSRQNTFGFAMGDFLELFTEGNTFDVVVSVFFIDTAKNPIAYVRAIYNMLKPGGVWLNFGPLLYHFADHPEFDSVEIPFDQLISIIEKIGFRVEKKEGPGANPPAYYARNKKSMVNYSYDCAYFECIKE